MNTKRIVNLWGFASKQLSINKKQTLALAIPLTIAIAVVAAMSFVRDGLRSDAHLSTAFLPDITVQMMSAGRSTHVPAGMIEQMHNIPGIKLIVPRIWGVLPIHTNGQDNAYTLLGIDPANMPIPADIRLSMKSGRFIRPDDRQCLVLGESVARSLHIQVGNTLSILTPAHETCDFHVIGIFTSAVQIYAADLMLTHIEDARNFFGYAPGEAADLCVYLRNAAQTDNTAAAITKSFPDCRVLTRDKLSRVMDQSYGSRSGIFQIVWLILLVNIVLLVWSQASSTALYLKKEVGILKALGWSVMEIIQTRIFSTAIIALLACFVGILLGIFYVSAGAPGVREYFLGWTAIYPEFRVPICLRFDSIITLLAIGTVPIIGAVVLPSWLVGISEPDRAIRGE